MELWQLSDSERRAFEAFAAELTFGGRVQLSSGERKALERCWLAASQWIKARVVAEGERS